MSSKFDFALYFQFQKAMNLCESDPDAAIDLLVQGRKDAIERNNDEWRLIFEHWRLQVTINEKRDFNLANRLVIESVVESRKPQYQNFREYICIQNDLILVYNGIDPIGYSDDIKEAIDITIDMTTPDMACHYCQNRALIDYYRHARQDKSAREQAAKFFAMTYNEPHYRIQAFTNLCYFSLQDEAWSDLHTLAEQGKDLAGDGEHESEWIEFKAYEMLALYHLGKVEAAEKAYELLRYRASTLKMVQGGDYYSLIRKYYEARNELHAALKMQDEYIATLVNSGRYYWECLARIERIRLLKLLERDYDSEVDRVRKLSQNLKSQVQMLKCLENTLI